MIGVYEPFDRFDQRLFWDTGKSKRVAPLYAAAPSGRVAG